MADPAPAPRTGMLMLSLATFTSFSVIGIYFTALQVFVNDELDLGSGSLGLAIGSYSVSAVLIRPVIGRGIDRRGRRPYLIGSLALMALVCLAMTQASSLGVLVALRLVQGLAGAGYYVVSASMATDLAPPARRAGALARFSLFMFTGLALGPVLGEALADRWSFAVASLAAAGLAGVGVLCTLRVPETGASAMAARLQAEAGPRHLIHPAAVAPGLVLMTTGVGYVSITGFSKLYAEEIGLGWAGALYVTFALSIMAMRLLGGGLGDTYSRVGLSTVAVGCGATGLAVLALVQHPLAAFPAVAVFAMCHALLFPSLAAFVVDRVPAHERGEALGTFTSFMDIGQGGGGYVIGFLVNRWGFGPGYGFPCVLCLMGGLLLWSLARSERAAGRGAAVPAP